MIKFVYQNKPEGTGHVFNVKIFERNTFSNAFGRRFDCKKKLLKRDDFITQQN